MPSAPGASSSYRRPGMIATDPYWCSPDPFRIPPTVPHTLQGVRDGGGYTALQLCRLCLRQPPRRPRPRLRSSRRCQQRSTWSATFGSGSTRRPVGVYRLMSPCSTPSSTRTRSISRSSLTWPPPSSPSAPSSAASRERAGSARTCSGWILNPMRRSASSPLSSGGCLSNCPPYGGVFADVVPHLTVAEKRMGDLAALQAAERAVHEGLPISTRVESLLLIAGTSGRQLLADPARAAARLGHRLRQGPADREKKFAGPRHVRALTSLPLLSGGARLPSRTCAPAGRARAPLRLWPDAVLAFCIRSQPASPLCGRWC